MPKRDPNFNEHLSQELISNPDALRTYLLTLMEGEDGLELMDALCESIRSVGIKEFAALSGINEKSISRMLSTNQIPKLETLDQYLAIFGLKIKIGVEEVA